MQTAKIIEHGEDRAVLVILPRDFPVEGDEVRIERRGEKTLVISSPKPGPKFETFDDLARYLQEKFPDAPDFPDLPPRPKEHERPIPEW